MDKKNLDLSNLLGPLQDLVKQFDEETLKNVKSSIDKDQLQDFLAGTFSMVKEHLKPEEQENIAEFLKSLLNISQGNNSEQ